MSTSLRTVGTPRKDEASNEQRSNGGVCRLLIVALSTIRPRRLKPWSQTIGKQHKPFKHKTKTWRQTYQTLCLNRRNGRSPSWYSRSPLLAKQKYPINSNVGLLPSPKSKTKQNKNSLNKNEGCVRYVSFHSLYPAFCFLIRKKTSSTIPRPKSSYLPEEPSSRDLRTKGWAAAAGRSP